MSLLLVAERCPKHQQEPSPYGRSTCQASGMLRGSLLAALAATATVSAGLVYLKPGESGDVREPASSGTTNGTDQGRPVEPEQEEGLENLGEESHSHQRSGEGRLSRMHKYRHELQRWLTAVAPSTRNMVRGKVWSGGTCPVKLRVFSCVSAVALMVNDCQLSRDI